MNTVAAKITEARKAARLTQEALAAKAGMSQEHICRLEKARKSPTVRTLVRLADAMGVPVASLLG